MKIVSVGEITIDHYPDLNRSFVGGISLNFAVNAKRCGADVVSLVSSVGTDNAGQQVLKKLAQEGIDASHIAIIAGETARIDIQVTDRGERIFPPGSYHRNVLHNFALTRADLTFIQGHDILVALYDNHQPEFVFSKVMVELDFEGKRVADFGDWSDYGRDYDPLFSLLEHLDLSFISGNNTTIDALLSISRRCNGIIVVTLGADGSVALVNGAPLFQPAQFVPIPIDSTGCGDAFQAAFTVTYFRSGSAKQALRSGTAHAATVLQHYGATN